MFALYLAEQLHTIHIGDIGVGDNDVNLRGLVLNELPSMESAVKGDDFAIGAILYGVYGEAAHELIIINDDDMEVCICI